MPVYHRVEIAKAHLHRAIVLFIEEKDFINSITLASAAEEILGKIASEANLAPAMEQLTDSLHSKLSGTIGKKKLRNDYLNRTKNSLKHFDHGNGKLLEIEPEEEAISMIVRAATNLLLVEGQLTEHWEIFYSYIKKNRPDLFEDIEEKDNENLTACQEADALVPSIALVTYVDVLGYKDLSGKIINNAQTVSRLENLFYDLTIGAIEKLKTDGAEAVENKYRDLFLKVLESFSVRVVSDNVVFTGWVSGVHADTLAGENRALGYCLETLFTVMSLSFSMIIAKTGYVLRGGISIGTHYESERQRYLFVLSEALNRAVRLEKKAKCPRILVDSVSIAYLTKIAYEHTDQFFYKDECGDHYFDWYGGLTSFPDDRRAQILREIRDGVTLNARNNVGNKEALRKLIHFGIYHNRKVTQRPLNYPDFTIDLTLLASLLM